MANVVAAPQLFKTKTIFAATESTYGTAAAIAGANWAEARNVSLTPFDAQVVDRGIVLPFKGRRAGLASVPSVKLSFDIALAPSGTAGTAPKWATMLLGCGWAETVVATTSVTYNLVSTGEQSLTLVYFDADNKHTITGARGSVSFKLGKGGIPLMSFSFTGIYNAPVVATLTNAMPTIVRTGWTDEQLVDSRYTTGSINAGTAVPLAFSEFNVDQANDVKYIDLPGPQTSVQISDRAPTGSISLLAPPLATLDVYALVAANTAFTVSAMHGTGAGKIATLAVKARATGVSTVEIDGFKGYQLTLQPEPVLATGNDEISLTLT
jgi:hypothetical protein